jgi:hypothetical protein
MGQFAEVLISAGRRPRGFADQLLNGIPADQFARLPVVGGTTVQSNHPAWIFGHLSLYPAKLLSFLGLNRGDTRVPESWGPLFQPGSECVDDAEGTRYPPMDELVSTYRRVYDDALERIPTVDDATLLAKLTEEPYASFIPTNGAAVAMMLASHVSFHWGQVSAWRRCMGLGPAS